MRKHTEGERLNWHKRERVAISVSKRIASNEARLREVEKMKEILGVAK